MSMAGSSEQAASPRVVDDVVCTSCPCLCDDIALEIEGERIVEAPNACPLGRDRFLGYRPRSGPACLIEGQPAALEEGFERAARILTKAGNPLIFGLGDTTTEAQRAAVSLADWIGAGIDAAGGAGSTMDALQSVGEVTCTLGEIKNRADLIVVWRADPLATHPRLFERYALDPAGTFIPGGRRDRYCVIVDEQETESVREAADEFIAMRGSAELAAIWILRALAKGVAVDAEAVESETGIGLDVWRRLCDRMKAARYGAWFYGVRGEATRSDHRIAQGIHSLVRELNETTRFVCQPLAVGGGNAVGARQVLAWHTGYPGPVSLAHGYPRHGHGEFAADDVLGRQEADAVLIVSGDPISTLAPSARERLSRIPQIVLTSDRDRPEPGGNVVFRTSTVGINTSGTFYRMDGVPLPLRRVLASPFPSDEDVLRAIERRVKPIAALAVVANERP